MKRRRRGQSAPRLRAARRPLELGCDILVRPATASARCPRADRDQPARRSLLPAPGARSAVRSARPLGSRRAHQRMTKAHPTVDFDQAGRLRRLEHRARDPEPLGCPPQKRAVTERLRRRGQQKALGLRRKGLQPVHKALLDPARQRERSGQPEPARQLRRRKPPANSNNADGFPASRPTAPRRPLRPAAPGSPTPTANAHRQLEDPDNQLRQARQQVALFTRSEQHHNRLRQQASRHKRHTLGRCPV